VYVCVLFLHPFSMFFWIDPKESVETKQKTKLKEKKSYYLIFFFHYSLVLKQRNEREFEFCAGVPSCPPCAISVLNFQMGNFFFFFFGVSSAFPFHYSGLLFFFRLARTRNKKEVVGVKQYLNFCFEAQKKQ
jgi:hypothetical protein